ncbi:MAG: hypothetical protein HYV60_21445, partial [Planctomycetia bacterium]|nr:hypothetical protein [Planctomycetia bacterium]
MSTTEEHGPDTRVSPAEGGSSLLRSEDWWAVWIGGALLLLCLLAVLSTGISETGDAANPLKSWFAKPGSWSSNPLDSVFVAGKSNAIPGFIGVLLVSTVAFGIGSAAMGQRFTSFAV